VGTYVVDSRVHLQRFCVAVFTLICPVEPPEPGELGCAVGMTVTSRTPGQDEPTTTCSHEPSEETCSSFAPEIADLSSPDLPHHRR
jgi:hypothetical protein